MLHPVDSSASAVAEAAQALGHASIPQQLTTYLRVTAGRSTNEHTPLVRLTGRYEVLTSLLANLDLLDRLPLSHACHALLRAVPPGPHIICSMFDYEGQLRRVIAAEDGTRQTRTPNWCPGLWESLSALLSRVPTQGVALRIESDLSDDLLATLGAWLPKISSLDLHLRQVRTRPHHSRSRWGRASSIVRVFGGATRWNIVDTKQAQTWTQDPLFQRLLLVLRQQSPVMHTLRLNLPTAEDRQNIFLPANLLSGAPALRRLNLHGVCIPPDALRTSFVQLVVFDYAPGTDETFDLGSMQEILDLMPSLVTLGLTFPHPHAPALSPRPHAGHARLRHVAIDLCRIEYRPIVDVSLTVLCDLISFFQDASAADLDFACAIPMHDGLRLPPDPRFNYTRVHQGHLWSHLWVSTDDCARTPALSMLSRCLNRAAFMFAHVVELSVNVFGLMNGHGYGHGPPPIAPMMRRLTVCMDICRNCEDVTFGHELECIWVTALWLQLDDPRRPWQCPSLRELVLTLPARSTVGRPGMCEDGCLLGIAGLEVFLRNHVALAPTASGKPLRSLSLPARKLLDDEISIARGLADEVILTHGENVYSQDCAQGRPVYLQSDRWENTDRRWHAAPSGFFDPAEPAPYIGGWTERNAGNTMGPYTRHVLSRRLQDNEDDDY